MPQDIFDQFFLQVNNINIFYHLLCINDGVDRFLKTYNKIRDSGLLAKIDHIYVNIVGNNQARCMKHLFGLNKVSISSGIVHNNESDTLNLMRNFCIKHPQGIVLYLHSKGVVRQSDPKITVKEGLQDWIDYMEYFLIERHKTCLKILSHKTTSSTNNNIKPNMCGVNLYGHHYSGNFWWAKNEYLATTQPCKNDYMYCELNFLFSGKNPKPYELHNTKFPWSQWFHRRYRRDEYAIS